MPGADRRPAHLGFHDIDDLLLHLLHLLPLTILHLNRARPHISEYSADVQVLMPAHTRSDVAVFAVASNCVLMSHAVSERQTRSEVAVGAVSSNSHLELQVLMPAHTGRSFAL